MPTETRGWGRRIRWCVGRRQLSHCERGTARWMVWAGTRPRSRRAGVAAAARARRARCTVFVGLVAVELQLDVGTVISCAASQERLPVPLPWPRTRSEASWPTRLAIHDRLSFMERLSVASHSSSWRSRLQLAFLHGERYAPAIVRDHRLLTCGSNMASAAPLNGGERLGNSTMPFQGWRGRSAHRRASDTWTGIGSRPFVVLRDNATHS